MLEFLPPELKNCIRHVNLNTLYELRIRADKPLTANIGGKYVYLGEYGIVNRAKDAYLPSEKQIEEIVFAASGYAVYSVENQIRQGFLTGNCGERIGLAGSYVYDGNKVLSVRTFSSLCIRIPHEIKGCAEKIFQLCLKERLCSVLIMSPPGIGKTTVLRDLCRLICNKYNVNVLVCDERGELSAGDLGASSDCMKFADKSTAFTAGIRALRPDLIVSDELMQEDYDAVRKAVEGGVNVLASAHLISFESVPQKLFSYYVFLKGIGEVDRILDGEAHELA